VRQVTPAGVVSTIAGTGIPGFSGDGGPARLAQLDRPLDLTLDSQTNLFIVDSLNGRVRRVDRERVIATVFDSGPEGGADSARYYPAHVAVDAADQLLIADPFCHRVFTTSGGARCDRGRRRGDGERAIGDG
jgi:hypothetical protein